eukprot:2714024-Pyramimonas_sp.AAC.1
MQKKGVHVKKARWFSLIGAPNELLTDWALLREAHRFYHVLFHGHGEEEFVEMSDVAPAGADTKSYKEEFRELKQTSGNGISLGAKLMTADLKRNGMRRYCLQWLSRAGSILRG